jgi:hopanoid-associated phosphorylase
VTAVAVTGLRAEAEIARRAGLRAVCAGGVPARTAAALERAVAEGASFLLSFGIAGALDPSLPPGALVVASAVLDDEGRAFDAVVPPVGGAVVGPVRGSAAIAATAAVKAALYADGGALCVDLESHVVAAAAQRAGLEFAVLRAIADPARRPLPPAALLELKPDGTPALGRVLGSVARHPGQIPALLRLALDTRAALRSLAAVDLAAVKSPSPARRERE